MTKKKTRYWMGEFEDGEIVVFCPEYQSFDDHEWVYLLSSQSGKIERYAKDIVKTVVGKIKNQEKAKELAKNILIPMRLKSWAENITGNEPRKILKGPWMSGAVIDQHTLNSTPSGSTFDGRITFENEYTETGKLLHEAKYKGNIKSLHRLSEIAVDFLGDDSKGIFDIAIPIPPSNQKRTITKDLAKIIARELCLDYSESSLIKVKDTPELKSISSQLERKAILSGAFKSDPLQTKEKRVLLIDDLYRSGATLEEATNSLLNEGLAKSVHVFAITKTRIHK